MNEAQAEIYEHINQTMVKREEGSVLRASAASRCVKARWYQHQGKEPEPMQPRAIMVFMLGDLVEHAYKNLIEQACLGPGKLYSELDFGIKTGTFTVQHREFNTYEQEAVSIFVSTSAIKNYVLATGHADGWGKRNSDGEWELIEIKSAAEYGYDSFERGNTPDYIKQVHALMMSDKAIKLNVHGCRFFYMNKNTSHICDRFYSFDNEIASEVHKEFVASISDREPEAPHSPNPETFRQKPTGRNILGFPCSYCGYKLNCFPQAQMEISKSGKPLWVVK